MAIGYNSYEITLKESLRPAITYAINDLLINEVLVDFTNDWKYQEVI